MFLSSSAFGLHWASLLARRQHGQDVWKHPARGRFQALGGMAAVGLVLLTASMGGTFSRGESLLDIFHLPYEQVPLMPMWLSGTVAVAIAMVNLVLMREVQRDHKPAMSPV